MINYGYMLLCKEKDNPSQMLRATYLFSNVGDLIKCYGRMIRFPSDAKLYQAEIKLALGDIMMQCRMSLEENDVKPMNIVELDTGGVTLINELRMITARSAEMFQKDCQKSSATQILLCCYGICKIFKWEPKEIEYLGYEHVMERFEQFNREGW